MRLPESMRDAARAPLGELIPDGDVDGRLAMLLRGAARIITVGDRTTERLLSMGAVPSLQIVDGLERRSARAAPDPGGAHVLRVDNPAAHVTRGAADAIRRAMGMEPPVRIHVTGEEDLLVIPACIHAPDGAVVLYGQPGEGMVAVTVGPQVRNKTAALLASMEEGDDETVAG
ncbi:MAG: GTP-dependent dephospho-CoA kinase family protein [Nitrosopumilus sp.]|nr:GTP-dependent dephospho-CoA kinase family protein [Nitrosopumilus sp.]CAI9832298.1 conserved hypothetical protein [Nitrosopumilaceae archaeon]MDA7941245.1 GTP-dependent dephospho-CoA kinase family protein [Nitrosopumilus sp.]MDA7942655.1 GTP-dependent dephospho-CoA kinase family protein [Nitrosopumilus sp.]MDA7945825.1 GTP-dependent dephospho-CoA kinase family protein [Nitrosopumilus sp.]